MRAILVCANTGRTVCTIDQSAGTIVIGRQQQFDIRDAACSREQARLELNQSESDSLTVTCVGAGKLCVELAKSTTGQEPLLLTKGETAVLSDGDAMTLGNSCRLKVKITGEPADKRPKISDISEIKHDSDESSNEVDRQLNIMRQTAARLSSQSEASNPISQLEDSKSAGQSNSSIADSQLKTTNVASQSNSTIEEKLQATPSGWRNFGTALVYTTPGCLPSCKIAGFDMDGTLITTQSGRVFPKDIGDWRIIYPQVPGRLKSLVNDGYKVAIFSNQKGVQAGKVTLEDLKLKIERIAARLGVPLQAFVSVRGHRHRKPCSGMWRLLVERSELNACLSPDLAASFFVGDAAGRPAETGKGRNGRKADFSCSDRLFALNCRLGAFHTPEEFFLGHRPVPLAQCRMPEFNPTALFDPSNAIVNNNQWLTEELRQLFESETRPLLVLLVGYPASGKSTLCRRLTELLRNQSSDSGRKPCLVSTVNRDLLGTWQRCVQSAETALRAGGDSVVLMRKASCWTTFQHRVDASVSFNRNWSQYASGFGQGESLNYWMGLERLHELTATGVWRVRWEFSDWNGTWYWAENYPFSVGSAADKYRASMGPLDSSRSSVGQSTDPDWSSNNHQFSTPEADNDVLSGGSCAQYTSSGWWFGACQFMCPNGVYLVPPDALSNGGLYYIDTGPVLNERYSMKTFECLIRQ